MCFEMESKFSYKLMFWDNFPVMSVKSKGFSEYSAQDLLMYMDPSLQHRREFSEQVN